jgi:hypothetical protein
VQRTLRRDRQAGGNQVDLACLERADQCAELVTQEDHLDVHVCSDCATSISKLYSPSSSCIAWAARATPTATCRSQ